MSTSNDSYHHGSLREALIKAGMDVLVGPDGEQPSLRALARDIGVSPTAVYRHFPNKDALNNALGLEGLKLLGAQQRAAAERVGGGETGFAETGRAYVRFALGNPALFRLMYLQGKPVDRGADIDPARKLLTVNTRALSASEREAERMALQAWSLAHGIAMLMLHGRIPAEDDLIDYLLDMESLFPHQGSSSEKSP